MAISERLQQRINNMAGMSASQPVSKPDDDKRFMMRALQGSKGAISDKDIALAMESLGLKDDPRVPTQKKLDQIAVANAMKLLGESRGAISDKELEIFESTGLPAPQMPMQKTPMQGTMSQPVSKPDDDKRFMMRALQGSKGTFSSRELENLLETASMGRKGDTQLGHLEVGDVVVPPSVIANNPILDEMLESTMLNQGIDPQQRIVGLGLASLNPNTGLEEFGIFDSITKGLEKFADRSGLKKLGKKLAPLAPIAAQFIPGGPIVSGAVGAGLQGLLGGQKPKDYLADAAMGAGIGALAQGATRGFDDMSIFDENGKLRQSVGMDIIKGLQSGGIKGALGNLVDEGTLAGGLLGIGGGGAGQAIVNEAGEVIGYTSDGGGGGAGLGGVLGGLLGGGGGGLGGALGLAGIGALSAGLGKLAYEDAKKQKGVPLTPLTTMSPTGRYNIEAEIARRQGLPAPNPVEFGLLPAGTLPKLSGGQPRGKNLGGAIEELEGGMARGMSRGGIMAFATGGAVAMQEGGEMDPSKFPPMDGDINGAGTETSDDIPAMLSDGEFVMTARAVRGAGTYDMNQDNKGIITLTPSMAEDRERGMDLMYKVMDAFSGQARPS